MLTWWLSQEAGGDSKGHQLSEWKAERRQYNAETEGTSGKAQAGGSDPQFKGKTVKDAGG